MALAASVLGLLAGLYYLLLGEPDLDFTRVAADAASGSQIEEHGTPVRLTGTAMPLEAAGQLRAVRPACLR